MCNKSNKHGAASGYKGSWGIFADCKSIYSSSADDISAGTGLTNGMKGDETFNMVTHSEGSAYGAGFAKGLIDMGYTVSEIVHLSADEGDEFITPKEPFTLQLAYDKDWVTGNKIIKNTDKFGLIDSSTLSWTQVHGFTKSSSIFKAVQDLKTALIYNNIGLYKGVFTSWWDVIPGSIHNDTFFTNINGFKLGQ